MALEPEGRFQSASDFREALRRVGRKENGERKETAIASGCESVNAATVNTTVVRTARVADVDPFNNYSILKPHDDLWLVPKPTRGPAVLVAILLILLVGGFVTFYGLDHWDESAEAVLDYAKVNPKKDSSGTNDVHTNKPDAAHLKPSSARNNSTDPAREPDRKNNAQKRRTIRATTAPSKSPALIPPPVSLLP